MKKLGKRIKGNWILALGAALGVLGVTWAAFGATYNIYFNNVEQGNNNTATPNVSISTDGKTTASQSLTPNPTASAVPTAPPPVTAASPTDTVSQTLTAQAQTGETTAAQFQHKLRLMAVANTASFGGGTGAILPEVGVGYSFAKSLGLNLYLGEVSEGGTAAHYADDYYLTSTSTFFAGLDLEVTPIRLSIGRLDDAFDLGFLFGASTINPSPSNLVAAHVGARATVNIGEQFGLTAAVRANLVYRMAEAGLIIRL